MQDLSGAGRSVLANRLPNSGTADRAMSAIMLGALGTGTAFQPGMAAAAVPALAYTGPGQRAAAWLLAGRQGPVARTLAGGVRSLSPALGAAWVSPGYNLLEAAGQ